MSQVVQLKVATEKLIPNLAYAFTSKTSFVKELLQNANRAGSSTISIWTNESGFVIEDDGVGITNMQDLLTVAESGWDESVIRSQKAFGIGWLSALFAADWVSVTSNGTTLEGMTADILNFAEVVLKASGDHPGKAGTRVELRGIKATENEIIHAANEFAKGFALPVELNGVLLARPHALDNPERTWVKTPVGVFSVPGFTDGEVQPDVHLYLQGFVVGNTSIFDTCYEHQSDNVKVVLHLDSEMFFARLPDRDVLIDHKVQAAKVKDAFRSLWSDHLLKEFTRMGGEKFLDVYTSATEKFIPELFERIPLLPASWLELINGVPDVGDFQDEFGVEPVSRHIPKIEIESEQATIVDLDDPEIEGSTCATWLYATKAGYYRLKKEPPTHEHWVHNHIVDLNEWELEIGGDVIASCDAWLPEAGGGTFRLVDQYHLRVIDQPDLPSFVVDDETLWSGDGFWIPVGDKCPGAVVRKMTDFTDQNGSYQEHDEFKAYSRMEAIVLDLKCPKPEDVLCQLLEDSPWRDFPSLCRGRTSFTVTFDRNKVVVKEEPVSEQIVDGLFDDAVSGLKEYYPKLLDADTVEEIRKSVGKHFSPSGNLQTDYQRVRDMVEAALK